MSPLHPQMVHLPLALSVLMPILTLVFIMLIKKQQMKKTAWIILIGLQLFSVGMSYVAMNTGEQEEEKVEELVGKSVLHEHEENAEMFIASGVTSLVFLVVAFFINDNKVFYFQLLSVLILVVNLFLSFRTGKSGGALVYQYGAASAYSTPIKKINVEPNGLLPTPDMNTSESENPVDENDYDADETEEDGSEVEVEVEEE